MQQFWPSLNDDEGNIIAQNEYCIPTKLKKHNRDKCNYPCADYSGLDKLAQARVKARISRTEDSIQVTLKNNSSVVAFFTQMTLKDRKGKVIVPAYWNDNFVTLAPKETRVFTCRTNGTIPANATVTISGWNVTEQIL